MRRVGWLFGCWVLLDWSVGSVVAQHGSHYPSRPHHYGWQNGFSFSTGTIVFGPGYSGHGYPYVEQGPLILPPLFVPAETMFGPQVARRFMGADQVNDPVAPAPRKTPSGKPKATNAETRAKAEKFVGYGDVHFAKQYYRQAIVRYRTAASVAGDMPLVFLKQAQALVALGKYPDAARLFERALTVRSDWSKSVFRLDQLYDGNQLAKTAHLEALAKAAEDNPEDGALLMLLGMQLFFDGQAERSQAFFERAVQLGAGGDGLLDSFLPEDPKADGKGKF